MENLTKDDMVKIAGSGTDKKVVEVYKILRRFKNNSARAAWITRRDDCWRSAIDNEFFTEDEKEEMAKKKQPPLSMNKLNKGIQGAGAIVTATSPEVKFNPVGSGDLYIAELLRRAHDYVWTKNEGSDATYAVVEEKNIGGHGFFEARHDPSKGIYGRLIFEETDPTLFYWDKDSRKKDFSDTHIIKAQLRTKSYIKENYPELKDEDLTFARELQDEEPGGKTDTVTGEDNYAVKPDVNDPDIDVDDDETKDIWEIEAWLLKVEKENWIIFHVEGAPQPQAARIKLEKGQKVADVVADLESKPEIVFVKHWPRMVEKRYLRIIVGNKLIPQVEDGKEVKERVNPYGMDADGDPVIPIIALTGQRTRNAYCTSPTFYAKDVNKALCKREAQFIFAASQGLNAPIVRDDSSKWSGTPGTPGSELIISKNAAMKPYRLSAENTDLSKLSFLIQEDKEFIDDQYDLHDVMRGKLPKNMENASGRLVLALQDMGGTMSKPSLRALESALVRLAKVNIAIILKNWPRYMWMRLLEEDEWETLRPDQEGKQPLEEQPQPIGQQGPQGGMGTRPPGMGGPPQGEDEEKEKTRKKWHDTLEKIRPMDPTAPPGISLIDLDVKLTAGSSMPTNRMAKQQVALEAFKAGLYDRQAALEYSDDPKAKEIAERMAKAAQQMAQQEMMKKRR